MEINKIHCDNFLNNDLPDKSVQLLIADPPYFQVKGKFDFIWDSFNDYLKDVEIWAKECKRLLADNGTLFWYGDAKKIAYTQIILDKHFTLLNSLVWEKNECQTLRCEIDSLRSFAPITERILMYSNDKDETGNEKIFEEFIKPNHPFAKYLKDEVLKTKTIAEFRKFVVKELHLDSAMVNRWIDGNCIISKERYLKIRKFLGREYLRREYEELSREYEELRREYEELSREYEELRREYEELSRPFNLPYMISDVLHYSQESHITKKFNHETKKPETLTRMLIRTCSKPNDLIFVPFAGSGTECAMAKREGRKYIGFDIEQIYVDMGNKRCKLECKTLF